MDSDLTLIVFSTLFCVKLWQKSSSLISHGKKAKAVVFRNNYKGVHNEQGLYFPVVRFLTDKQEWVTQELSIGQNPPMEEGKQVQVIYDPEDPSEVEINTIFRLEILPRFLVAVGLCGVIIGFIMYLEIVEFSLVQID